MQFPPSFYYFLSLRPTQIYSIMLRTHISVITDAANSSRLTASLNRALTVSQNWSKRMLGRCSLDSSPLSESGI